MKKKQKIIIAGDQCIDWLSFQTSTKNPREKKQKSENWRNAVNTAMSALPGGVLLIRDLLKSQKKYEIISYPENELELISPNDMIHSLAEISEFHVRKNSKERTYRINKFLGYCGPAESKKIKITKLSGSIKNVQMVILDDSGNGFRDNEAAWKNILKNLPRSTILVLKMSWPLVEGKLWNKVLDIIDKENKENVILILNADDLREDEIFISRRLSWERTILDFYYNFPVSRMYSSLKKIPHLLIRFGLETVLYIKQLEKTESIMFYMPNEYEGEFSRSVSGEMQGLTSSFVVGLVEGLSINQDAESMADRISRSVSKAMAYARNLLSAGYKIEGGKVSIQNHLVINKYEYDSIQSMKIPDFNEKEFLPAKWTLLDEHTQENRDLTIAKNYVKGESETTFSSIPIVHFGKMVTIDRDEIESFRSINNLIQEYLSRSNKRPLSIAVFGPPGSGKSFGVKQVAKSIGQQEMITLEYNLSQFESPADLIHSFHEIRDYALKGIVPLVFFDEFDASYKSQTLGWLKYFLAPMQDGEFREGEKNHPIGQAIFVFAGGTNHSFQKFTEKEKTSERDFVNAKGPDFISRLRGYVNILGPNRKDLNDRFFIFRRAVLLREILIKQKNIVDKNNKIHIDDELLNAFLLIPRYKHGSRSMSAIIDMSMMSRISSYEKSALPGPGQLDLHVDGQIFMNILEYESFFKQYGEEIAKMIHAQYLEDQKKKKKPKSADHVSMQPWDKGQREDGKPSDGLRKDLKESNRGQAKDIFFKLLRINCAFRLAENSEEAVKEFTKDEIEILSIMEHKRWMEEKILSGWKYATVWNDDKKLHDSLLPWDALNETTRQYDRDTVIKIPEILEKLGYEIYRLK